MASGKISNLKGRHLSAESAFSQSLVSLGSKSSRDLSWQSHHKRDDDFNIKATTNELHEIVRLFDINPTRATTRLQTLVTRFANSEAKKRWLLAWVDHRGLDLLHCAIISEKPSIILYLLRNTFLFPASHNPRTNPYGHLAAMLGNKDCLEAVLTHRPGDYFAATEPHHAVKLPPDVMRRLKLGNEIGMASRSLERIVRLVKHETAAAEQKIAKSAGDDTLEKELKEFEKSFSSPTHKTAKHKQKFYQGAKPAVKFIGSLQQVSSIENNKLPIIEKKKHRNETKVTVYRNVFDDDTLDRVENNTFLMPKLNVMPKNSTAPFGINSHGSSNLFKHMLPKEKKKQLRSNKSINILPPRVEFGIKKVKKYKEFIPVIESKTGVSEDTSKYLGKTPLTLAAEKNRFECVNFLLKHFHLKKGVSSERSKDTITLAAKARSPEALALLLKSNVSPSDYQSAVLVSLRNLYPDSLRVLLSLGGKNRTNLFEGTNLFHILYSQSLQANCRYSLLPEMTRILIQCNEEVNARYPPRTFPIYTLIQCAFNVVIGKESMHYLKCLKLLMNAKANPHFDETAKTSQKCIDGPALSLNRTVFLSAIHCVLNSAVDCLDYNDLGYWPQIMLQKFIEAIEMYDKTPRRVSNDSLLLYMSYVCRLGLNRRILKTLLRYGANPDHAVGDKYPLNVFFDEMLPYLTKFEVKHKFQTYDDILDTLLILCRAMRQVHLHRAVVYFLDNHLFATPIQALSLSRKFCYYTNKMLINPRSLSHIAGNFIWLTCGRDSKRVRKLPLDDDNIQIVLP